MRIRSENITRDEFAKERSHDYDSDYSSIMPFATTQKLVIVGALAQPVDTELPANKELVWSYVFGSRYINNSAVVTVHFKWVTYIGN